MYIWILFSLAWTVSYTLETFAVREESIPSGLVNSNHLDEVSLINHHEEIYPVNKHKEDHNPWEKAETTYGLCMYKKPMINSTIRKQWGKLIRGEKSLAPSLESLNTYYEISRQITQHEGGSKIYPLASFVSQLMDHFQPSKAAAQKFTLRDGKSFKEDVNKFITRALEVLQDAYLEPRERLWTLGILSWFKHNLAKSFCQELRDFREGDEVTRGEAELSLLSEQLGPLEIEVQRMWHSKTAPKNQEIQDMTLKEPLERIRMVRAFEIHRRDRYPNFVPSISFTKIYNDFLKLPVPLNVVESQKFVKKVVGFIEDNNIMVEGKLLAKGRYSAVEQDLVYHMWSRHLDIFQGHELRTRRIFSSQYDLSADCVNARCQFECFDPLEDNTPSIMEDVLGQVRKMSFHNLENVMEAGKKMSETSPEIGVKILNILLASSRLDPDAKVNVKKWIQTFDTCPLYLAQILKLISPDLVPNVLDEVHYQHQIFEFNHSLIPSARRVILEEMLVKKKIVAQETLDKYKYIEWVNPPTKDSNLNELLDNLMAIFRSENMKEETSHKELLFEYIAQLLVHGYGAREHMRGLFEPKDIKDPGSEIQFFHEAVRNPSRISGIAPDDYLDVVAWAKSKLSHIRECEVFLEQQKPQYIPIQMVKTKSSRFPFPVTQRKGQSEIYQYADYKVGKSPFAGPGRKDPKKINRFSASLTLVPPAEPSAEAIHK